MRPNFGHFRDHPFFFKSANRIEVVEATFDTGGGAGLNLTKHRCAVSKSEGFWSLSDFITVHHKTVKTQKATTLSWIR